MVVVMKWLTCCTVNAIRVGFDSHQPPQIWFRSSIGRVLACHARGSEIETRRNRQSKLKMNQKGFNHMQESDEIVLEM